MEKATLERELKQEKENVKKALRELQNKCFEYETLEAQSSAAEAALKMKEA